MSIPDNVFRYELGRDVTKIQTPLKVLNPPGRQEKVVTAVWDTGSTVSSISERIVRELNMTTDGRVVATGISGDVCKSSSICFAFPGNQRFAALVEASHIPDVPGMPDFIIGLDIISMGEFRLTWEDGRMVLYFIFDTSQFIDFEQDDGQTIVEKMSRFNEKLRKMWGK